MTKRSITEDYVTEKVCKHSTRYRPIDPESLTPIGVYVPNEMLGSVRPSLITMTFEWED